MLRFSLECPAKLKIKIGGLPRYWTVCFLADFLFLFLVPMVFVYLHHSFCLYIFFHSVLTAVLCGGKLRGYHFPISKWRDRFLQIHNFSCGAKYSGRKSNAHLGFERTIWFLGESSFYISKPCMYVCIYIYIYCYCLYCSTCAFLYLSFHLSSPLLEGAIKNQNRWRLIRGNRSIHNSRPIIAAGPFKMKTRAELIIFDILQ